MSRADAAAAFDELIALDATTLDAPSLHHACAMVARVRGFLDGVDCALATRAAALHAVGAGAPAHELIQVAERVSARGARRVAERAETIRQVPAFGEALSQGHITAGHADALGVALNRLDGDVRDAFTTLEPELVRLATQMPPEAFARQCRRMADQIGDGGLPTFEAQRHATNLRRWINRVTGMYHLHAELDPETGHAVFTAIDAELERLWRAEHPDAAIVDERARDIPHLEAHALAGLVHRGHEHAGGAPVRAEVTVLVDAVTLVAGVHERSVCELGDGGALPIDTVRRLACDADILPVVLGGDGVPLDVGRRRRVATRDQRRALRTMYRSCAFGECDVSFARCHIHHLLEWDHGGGTDLHNLLPLCSRHHHLVHEGRWRLQLDGRRTITITRPDGALHAVHPLGDERQAVA